MKLSSIVIANLLLLAALALPCSVANAQGGQPQCDSCTESDNLFPATVKDSCGNKLGDLSEALSCQVNGSVCDVVGTITWDFIVAGQGIAPNCSDCNRWHCGPLANGGSRSSSPALVLAFQCPAPPFRELHDHSQTIPCDGNAKTFDAIIFNQGGDCVLGGAAVKFTCKS